MPFPDFHISSISKDTDSTPVGASTASAIGDQYYYHEHTIKWIQETKHKIPRATPLLRKEAFLADPLLKGTLFPYLKNVLLQGFTIQTEDNKLYADAIKEITAYLESIDLMGVFREDFLDFMILTGHTYRRMDIDIDKQGNKQVSWLEKIEPSSVTSYTDAWDSSVVAYHQHSRVFNSWSRNVTSQDVDSWFIPFQNKKSVGQIDDIYATYIKDRGTGNDLRVFDLFETYKTKYGITDISNLRIASSERIIAMHNAERLKTNNQYYDDEDHTDSKFYDPAPIDPVLLAIWLKRLLLSNAPHLVYIVINPFLHAKSGILKEGKDAMGNPVLTSSIPPKPSSALQTSNAALYNQMLANHNAWIDSVKEAQKDIMKTVKNGGVFTSGPDLDIKPVESSRAVTYLFIRNLIDSLNEEIGQAFGFPMALVQATGTELASSRNILQMFNTVHAGIRQEYEAVANKLIKTIFKDKSWVNEVHFVLDTPDTKDLLNEAQTFKTNAEGLVQIKALGASQEDMQALGEEVGLGILGLDNYSAPMIPPTGANGDGGANHVNAIDYLKALVYDTLQEGGYFSTEPTDPSGFEDGKVVKQLQEAYEEAKKNIDHLFDEG